MSDTGSTSSSLFANLNLSTVINGVSTVVNALAPVAEVAMPEAAAAIAIGQKIIQGAIEAEPTAVALFKQITSGTPPTAAQLASYASQYEVDYQKLNTDINAKLAIAT